MSSVLRLPEEVTGILLEGLSTLRSFLGDLVPSALGELGIYLSFRLKSQCQLWKNPNLYSTLAVVAKHQ